MAKLGGLISGQDIAFDTHQAGDRQSPNFRSLHLEKRRHNRRGKVRFPLFGVEEPTCSGMNKKDFNSIVSEIRRELKRNAGLIEELAKLLVTEMHRFGSNEATAEKCLEAARRIGDYFDLDSKIIGAIAKYSGDKLVMVNTLHFSTKEKNFFEIQQSPERIGIRAVKINGLNPPDRA